jgi:predicted nucleic acid-binding protein
LALDSNLTSYDVSYLALAHRLQAGLATHDVALIKAAKKTKVPVWEPHE